MDGALPPDRQANRNQVAMLEECRSIHFNSTWAVLAVLTALEQARVLMPNWALYQLEQSYEAAHLVCALVRPVAFLRRAIAEMQLVAVVVNLQLMLL